MTVLTKFCERKYNPLNGCQTLRLGTFDYYRNFDPSARIADATEAVESVDILNLDTDTASPGAIAEVDPIRPGPHNQIRYCHVHRRFANCFIWCCSNLPANLVTTEYGQRFDGQYDSLYEVGDADRFADHLTFLVARSITRAEFDDHSREQLDRLPIVEATAIAIRCIHRPVVYVEAKHSTIDHGSFQAYTDEIPAPLRPVFVKPDKYSEDHEYRFVVIFEHPRLGILAVREDPVDVAILPINEVHASQPAGTPCSAGADDS